MKTDKDTPPSAENLIRVPFEETVPDVTWYRHESWQPGQYKRFRHFHTMSQNVDGFEFFNDSSALGALKKLWVNRPVS